jgi:polysaccharide biosynthesis/export protein
VNNRESGNTIALVGAPAVPPSWRPSVFAATRGASLVLLVATALTILHGSEMRAQVEAGPPARTATDGAGVQPGDIIRLKVWREPDMSGDVVIDAAGQATFPRLGRIPVAGWPADSLRRFLTGSFAKYLKDPVIEITVLPRVTILGAVRNPGVQNVDPTLTIADALALAGGASSEGKQDNIELRRRGARVPVKLSLGARLADTPVRSGDQLYVPERSWLARNTGVILGIVSASTGLMYFIFR